MFGCVGVGKCRRGESGTMCPSYMVTREEKHSTRGRARMLFEMLQGEVIHDGWHSKEVLESLDLCLACKGCQSDCPMHVDMATYKAEFLSHYYEHRLRPRHAYAMGLIHIWSRIASKIPRLVNFLGDAPILGNLIKCVGGISQKRNMPKFATETFRAWWVKREKRPESGLPIVLWVDTFNDHFHPQILRAAVEVLEATGHKVIIPKGKLCCGRPLYDFGMLDYAKKLLAQILLSLRKEIRAEIPIIGLEPSCVSVFRDELKRLFPFDEDADRLARRVVSFGEFFTKYSDFVFPKLNRRALVHGHCHDKAVMKMEGAADFLKNLGLEFQMLDSGCCGMAGSFGFEAEHYEVSVRCGERVLLPSVREADSETLLIADGFSCREQIKQLTHRRALHTAEVAAKALREGSRQNPEGKKIIEPHTIPEMQDQSQLNNRTQIEPMEIGHEHQ
jgi:Fe-S oxidoreductase